MTRYLALLRGVNVGGKAMIRMADLQAALTADGLTETKTYIQSGNVLFASDEIDTIKLAAVIKASIFKRFALTVDTVVYDHARWRAVINGAPAWWGADRDWKHNLIVMIPPATPESALHDIGATKPDIEQWTAGDGVIYESMSIAYYSRGSVSKLIAAPAYKSLTIRNYNTATKLLALLDAAAAA